MTPRQPQRADDMFAISRHELTLLATNGFWDRQERIDTLHAVESRPLPAATPSDDYNKGFADGYIFASNSLADHDTAIRSEAYEQGAREERERVLNKVVMLAVGNSLQEFKDGGYIYHIDAIKFKTALESLRSASK